MDEIVEAFPLIENEQILLNNSDIRNIAVAGAKWKEDVASFNLSAEEMQAFESLFTQDETALNITWIEFKRDPSSVVLCYRDVIFNLGSGFGHYQLMIGFNETDIDMSHYNNTKALLSGFYKHQPHGNLWRLSIWVVFAAQISTLLLTRPVQRGPWLFLHLPKTRDFSKRVFWRKIGSGDPAVQEWQRSDGNRSSGSRRCVLYWI